jgi:hypothetical protein
MLSRLSRLFVIGDRSVQTPTSSLPVGYTYSCEGADNRLANASIGTVARNPNDKPPWIVVDRQLETMVLTRWPGRLFKVEVLDAAPEQVAGSAHYIRAVAVRVIAEEPAAVLFGPHGPHVCRVLDAARSISVSLAEKALELTSTEAQEAYSAAWNRWIARTQPNSQHLGDDHRTTLAATGPFSRSPIGAGFGLIYSTVFARAKELVGDSSFSIDGEGEISLAPKWSAAADSLLHAAMALGAPEIVSASESVALLASWNVLESEL